MSLPSKPAVVALDLDDTLVKLDVDWAAPRMRLAGLARAAGIETRDSGIRALMHGARLPGMETLRASLEREVAEAELAGACGPRNEVLIEWLDRHAEGSPVSILSLNSRRAVLRSLECNGLAERVAHVVAREDVLRGKPDPEGMRILAELHGVEPARMLLIGDAESDRLCAERARVRFLHVNEVGIEWHRRDIDS